MKLINPWWIWSWGTAFLLAQTAMAPVIAQTSPTAPGICPAQLPEQIDQILRHPKLSENKSGQNNLDRARWGILVQHLEANPKTLYDRESQRFFLPASTAKLITTAAALEKWGGDYRIRTSILGQSVNGSWNLRLIGKGDPGLTDAQLTNLAQQLKRQGVQTIRQLILDDRAFVGEPVNPTWEWGDLQESYAPIVNSLILNQNAIKVTLIPQKLGQPLKIQWQNSQEIAGWTVENQSRTVAASEPEFTSITRDSRKPILRVSGQLKLGAAPEALEIAAPDPGQILRDRFQTILTAEKITVQQITLLPSGVNLVTPIAEREMAFVESQPMRDLIRETNQESNNLYAEVLLKQLASDLKLGESSTESGIKALQAGLIRRKVNASSYQLLDGSGLSRMNLVSPEALVQVLQGMATSSNALDYRRSLSVAGRSGTLSNRFRNTAAQDILQAKTGTITNVAALAGYLSPPQYQPLAFSILLNQSTASNPEQRETIDRIVLLLTQLRRCSP